MSTTGEEAGEYNPSAFMRGGVSGEDKADGCGVPERGHVCSLRVETAQGSFGLPYPPEGHAEFADRFEAIFKATLPWGGKRVRASWALTVRGRKLDNILRQISLGKRFTLRPGGEASGELPQVTEITLEPFEPDDPDDE